jgi:hypothetical protein
MNPIRELFQRNDAGRKFREGFSLFPEGLFVKAIVVYADESGTHDRAGRQPGSQYPTIAGFVAPPSAWSQFCVEWQAVLNAYGVPYFHSREFRAVKAAIEHNKKASPELEKNPYYGWNIKRLNTFLTTLAEIAGRGNKVPIAGTIRTLVFHEIKANLEIDNPEQIQMGDDPYKYSMGEFFQTYHKETFMRWGNFKCPVTFFFDRSTDHEWTSAFKEVYDAFANKDLRMSGISFVDKKVMPHLPLQAADMLAYRLRQAAAQMADDTFKFTEVDHLLLTNLLKGAAKANPKVEFMLKTKKYEKQTVHRLETSRGKLYSFQRPK